MASRYQKQHYEDVAKIIREGEYSMAAAVADDFINLFAFDNPLFDRKQFLAACGLETDQRTHDGRCGEGGCTVC